MTDAYKKLESLIITQLQIYKFALDQPEKTFSIYLEKKDAIRRIQKNLYMNTMNINNITLSELYRTLLICTNINLGEKKLPYASALKASEDFDYVYKKCYEGNEEKMVMLFEKEFVEALWNYGEHGDEEDYCLPAIFKDANRKNQILPQLINIRRSDIFKSVIALRGFALIQQYTKTTRKKTLSEYFKESPERKGIITGLEQLLDLAYNLVNDEHRNHQSKHVESLNFLKNMVGNFPFNIDQPISREKIEELGILKFSDRELVEQVLKLCIENNAHYYKETIGYISKEYTNSQPSQIEQLLLGLNITTSMLSKESLEIISSNIAPTKIEEIAEFIQTDTFQHLKDSEEVFMDILFMSDKTIFSKIKDYHESGIISESFIEQNPGILLSEEIDDYQPSVVPKYNTLIDNIELLRKKRISIDNKDAENILLIGSLELEYNLEMAKRYGFKIGTKDRAITLKIIENLSLLDLVDQYIELGLFDYVKSNDYYLNKKFQLSKSDGTTQYLIQRCICAQMLGLPVFNKDNRLDVSISTGKGFLLSQTEIEDTIPESANKYMVPEHLEVLERTPRDVISKKTEELPFIRKLDEENLVNQNLYQIGDTKISRVKVLRNTECLINEFGTNNLAEIAISSIYYNSHIDYQQRKEIRSTVSGIQLIK